MKTVHWLLALGTMVAFWLLALIALVILGGVSYASKSLWGVLG